MNSFPQTPPMGWNSYDYYDTTVTEAQVKTNAAFLAEHLKAFGWEYVVVDIQWYANDAGTKRAEHQYIPFGDHEMDAWGRFQPSPSRFPSSADGSGFRKLADYVHGLGLKFGIHIMRGIPRRAAQDHCRIFGTEYTADMAADPYSICLWNPDMYGVRQNDAGQAYYDSLIAMYADWGVDFIKCDDICHSRLYDHDDFSGWHETEMLHKAILKTGRSIVLSLSPGPARIDRAWRYEANANMWRITDDFWDSWELLKNMFWRCELWQDHVKEGGFPDCDMLPLGKLGKGFGSERTTNFTKEEQKTMMTLWCMFRSPLMIGADLPQLDSWTLSLLTNRLLLRLLDKDCKGTQLSRDEGHAIWKNESQKTGEICVALFNLSDEERKIAVFATQVWANPNGSDSFGVDIWDGTAHRFENGIIEATVPAHGVKGYLFTK